MCCYCVCLLQEFIRSGADDDHDDDDDDRSLFCVYIFKLVEPAKTYDWVHVLHSELNTFKSITKQLRTYSPAIYLMNGMEQERYKMRVWRHNDKWFMNVKSP